MLRLLEQDYREEWNSILKCKNFTSSWGGTRKLPFALTKGWEYAVERKKALSFLGFKEQEASLIGHENEKYFNCWLFNKKVER